ncbi:unnamed protein product [Closterium sp. NIES-54]
MLRLIALGQEMRNTTMLLLKSLFYTRCSGVAHKGYNPIRGPPHSAAPLVASPCPARRVALLAVALPCPVIRVALLAVALPCCMRAALLPVHRPALPALSHPAARTALLRATLLLVPPCCAQPCWPAPCCPHHPAARRPAACAARLLPALLRAALLADALLRAALLLATPSCCPPCCEQPCWPAPCCPRATLLAAALLLRALLAGALLAGALLAGALLLERRPACVLLCWSRATLLCPLWLLSRLTRDAAARLAIRNHLLLAERAHFGQHKTAKAMYVAVVTRYSSPATAALGHLILPYLFPELSPFATVEDLVTHLRTSDARYRAALPAKFLDRNPPPMYITLYFIVTRLPNSLRAIRDHFLTLDPTDLTVNLLEKHLLAAETSIFAVGAARGTPRTPLFEGCSPSPLAPSYASAAAVNILGAENVGATSALSGKRRYFISHYM